MPTLTAYMDSHTAMPAVVCVRARALADSFVLLATVLVGSCLVSKKNRKFDLACVGALSVVADAKLVRFQPFAIAALHAPVVPGHAEAWVSLKS